MSRLICPSRSEEPSCRAVGTDPPENPGEVLGMHGVDAMSHS